MTLEHGGDEAKNCHLWHVIAEANSAHGDEDEVEALEEAPALGQTEQRGAYENVTEQDEDGHGDW